MRSVTRVGGEMRLTVLGAAGTLEGFDTFWQAAADVLPTLAPPEGYVHHRLGDVAELHTMVSGCGWQVGEVRPIVSVRHCDADELWRWLWGSLPLRTSDGAFLSDVERRPIEAAVRERFFLLAQRFSTTGAYVIRSLANMVVATAIETNFPSTPTMRPQL